MASILDKYKSSSPENLEQIGQDLKEQGIEIEGDTKQSEVGKDNVNVAGGYEHLSNASQPDNDKLAASYAKAQKQIDNSDVKDGLSQVQIQEQEQER